MIYNLPKSLIDTAKKILLESLEHPMIDVDGELKHRHNSNGTPIHHTDEGIRNFHRWFDSSKAVDEHGRPQVFYHGTDKSFNTFDPSKHGDKDHGWYGHGHYFTPDRDTASAYSVYDEKHPHGANVMPVYLKVHKPFKWSQEMEPLKTKEDSAESTKSLKAMGHDGVFVQNKYCNPEHEKFYETVVFHPNQIKSALGNTGEFKHSENINESSEHPMIDVDGVMKHRNNSEGNPIHHTDEGIRNFHRWFGDSDSVDEHGRPKVYHHGTPALSRSQDENTPLPFNEFKHSGSGVTSFSPTHRFAHQYADTKSMDAEMDLAPFVFKTYLKTKTFDPNNQEHMSKLSNALGSTVKHSGKYGWSSWGGEKEYPKEQFMEKLSGIHDVYRPLTKEKHENAVVGKMMELDGGQIYVHHKTPTHIYYSEAYQIHDLHPEHFAELKSEAQQEPEKKVSKEFKFARHESRSWDLVRKKVNINNTTWVPAKERGDNWEYTENDEVHGAMKKLGFNAIKQTERKNENVAVLDRGQIKSATHNRGSFSHPTHIDE